MKRTLFLVSLTGSLAFIFIVGVLVCTSDGTAVWSSTFWKAEYRIRFLTPELEPIEGVQLRVEDCCGKVYYGYPVSNYWPETIPESAGNGEVRFVHIGYQQPEYGGRCVRVAGVRFGDCIGPRYICRFMWQGREVGRIPFEELNREITADRETSTVRWNWQRSNFMDVDDAKVSRRDFQIPQKRGDTIESRAHGGAAMAYHSRLENRGAPRVETLSCPLLKRDVIIDLACGQNIRPRE